jgi:hypothetical protein
MTEGGGSGYPAAYLCIASSDATMVRCRQLGECRGFDGG